MEPVGGGRARPDVHGWIVEIERTPPLRERAGLWTPFPDRLTRHRTATQRACHGALFKCDEQKCIGGRGDDVVVRSAVTVGQRVKFVHGPPVWRDLEQSISGVEEDEIPVGSARESLWRPLCSPTPHRFARGIHRDEAAVRTVELQHGQWRGGRACSVNLDLLQVVG